MTIPSQQLRLDSQAKAAKLKHIMIIAGRVELAETLQLELCGEGYQVSVIHDGLRGLLAVKRVVPDLVIIGWSPSRMTGLEICDRLRSTQCQEPVILLTEGDSAKERIAGLNAGACDCISLPFVKEELIARIQANLSRQLDKSVSSSVVRCADLLLNRKTREVFRAGQLIRLTAREFDLLEYMMDHYFQVLSRAHNRE